jgi:hypothetical protein
MSRRRTRAGAEDMKAVRKMRQAFLAFVTRSKTTKFLGDQSL